MFRAFLLIMLLFGMAYLLFPEDRPSEAKTPPLFGNAGMFEEDRELLKRQLQNKLRDIPHDEETIRQLILLEVAEAAADYEELLKLAQQYQEVAGETSKLNFLLELASYSTDATIQSNVARLIGDLGLEAGIPLLRKLTVSQHEVAKVWATRSLGKVEPELSHFTLLLCLKDRSPKVRMAAAEVLGKMSEKDNSRFLFARVSDQDWRVRHMARQALREHICDENANRFYREWQRGGRKGQAACIALGYYGEEEVVGDLKKIMAANQKADPGLRIEAALALIHLDNEMAKKLRRDSVFEPANTDLARMGDALSLARRLGTAELPES